MNILKQISQKILNIQKKGPILVGINGIDGSGKTHFTKKLQEELKKSGKNIINISVDGFLNTREARYQKGSASPEGFYLDTYNYNDLKKETLDPFKKGEGKYTSNIFDIDNNSHIDKIYQDINKNDILLFEGIFIFRPNLINYWDLKIFIDVDFDVSLKRNINRETDIKRIGNKKEIIKRYKERYMPGQKLYFKDANPKDNSDIVIDNNAQIQKGNAIFRSLKKEIY